MEREAGQGCVDKEACAVGAPSYYVARGGAGCCCHLLLPSPCLGGKVSSILDPPGHFPTTRNYSESLQLLTLSRLLLGLYHRGNASSLGADT